MADVCPRLACIAFKGVWAVRGHHLRQGERAGEITKKVNMTDVWRGASNLFIVLFWAVRGHHLRRRASGGKETRLICGVMPDLRTRVCASTQPSLISPHSLPPLGPAAPFPPGKNCGCVHFVTRFPVYARACASTIPHTRSVHCPLSPPPPPPPQIPPGKA